MHTTPQGNSFPAALPSSPRASLLTLSSTSLPTFSDRFGSFGAEFSQIQNPTPLPNPYLIAVSASNLSKLGMSPADSRSEEFVSTFSGNQLPPACVPRAAVYSGHQFGQWAGQLGDGRALLLGNLAGFEVQLKGAGPTPYSRHGDGRAVLRSSIREYLCSEAMAGLGIPTTRALCLTGSEQMVMRETPETAAVVTRLAPSFVRFGSFEHWFYKQDYVTLKKLADAVIASYYPSILTATNGNGDANPYLLLLSEVTRRTAQLVAQWQSVGFMHGVLNTDNMSILGLTLDYGPFGFMEAFDPHHICNHSDDQGRYSFARQPQIGAWNCRALAQALLPLSGTVEDTLAAISGYQTEFERKLSELWHAKLGLETVQQQDDELIQSMLNMMQTNQLDFTIFFRRLGNMQKTNDSSDHLISNLCVDRALFNQWMAEYRIRLQHENRDDVDRQTAMQRTNPKFILRNYLAQKAIEAAQQHDFSEITKLSAILANPFDEQPEHEAYADLPPNWGRQLAVSCSS